MKLLIFLLFFISFSEENRSNRKFTFKNDCNFPIWVGSEGIPLPGKGGWKMDSKETKIITVSSSLVSGRFWPRTNCIHDSKGHLQCETGQCYISPDDYVDDGTECNPKKWWNTSIYYC